jgi:WD40 repeat protein
MRPRVEGMGCTKWVSGLNLSFSFSAQYLLLPQLVGFLLTHAVLPFSFLIADYSFRLLSFCLHILRGHTSTIRCVKALDGRPVAVSASRDGVARVWDIQKGICLRVLEGHTNSVRSLDVAGNVCVTASYDTTARVSNVQTLPASFAGVWRLAF